MKRALSLVRVAASLALALGCRATATRVSPPDASAEDEPPAEARVEMPDAPGRDRVQAMCIACHSLRYVLDQPPLPRKTWQAEVDKMKNAFGARFAPDDEARIVDYLVAIRGDTR